MKKLKTYRYFLWLTIMITLIGMTTCGTRETELPFETIERNDTYSPEEGYSDLEPRVVLITSQEEMSQVDGLISQAALGQLAALDFEQYFAIVVFRGRQPYSGYDTIIERVVRRDGKIVLHVQFWEPSPYYEVLHTETSPYHLVKVHKDGDVSQGIELVLQSQVVTPTPPSH